MIQDMHMNPCGHGENNRNGQCHDEGILSVPQNDSSCGRPNRIRVCGCESQCDNLSLFRGMFCERENDRL
ncbi:MAG: hypothetical protein FWF85_06925 [Clostridiales bacterium]|nr:hypothetical protein [Clostridiales bacterium]